MSEFDPDTPPRTADELRRVAQYQRWLAAVLLTQLVLWGVVAALHGLDLWLVPLAAGVRFPMILSVILGGVGAVYVLLLYWVIRGPVLAVVMAAGCVLPLIGVLVILSVNATAINVLRSHGVRVRFFQGAIEGDLDDDRPLYDDADASW
jgi:hypothetical protein